MIILGISDVDQGFIRGALGFPPEIENDDVVLPQKLQ